MAWNCTMKTCKLKATSAVRMCYRLPPWMKSYVITLSTYSRYGRPTAGLSVARIRPHNSQIFSLAESGNVAGLKYAFDHGLASPFDISAQTGDYPLHITADHGFVDACRLLVSYGADPFQRDMGELNTPHSFAWALILGNTIPSQQKKQLSALFPDVYSSLELPTLHRLALELKPGSFDLEAAKPGFDVDIQDGEGNTALQWACLRGDIKAAEWLLSHRADPNIPNFTLGRTPLMAACSCVSVSCIKILLKHGADVNARSRWGLDAMLYLCEEDRNPQPVTDMVEIAELFISHGIDLNPYGETKVWCLARAARTEIIDLMDLITDQGIDINQTNNYGLTALARSITWGTSRSVEFLLGRGASYTGPVERDQDGRTLLHHAALNPNLGVAKVLINAKLQGLDPDIRDKSGAKTEEYFARSDAYEEGLVPAFRQLFSDLRARLAGCGSERSAECTESLLDEMNTEDEDFFDALENW